MRAHILVRFQLQCEGANQAACQALEAKNDGDLRGALEAHALAAKAFRECAVLLKDRNTNIANSLLLLSQTQAKSALALKRIVKQQPANPSDNSANANDERYRIVTQKDRLRAAVRGALVTRNEEDISDSAFLGKAAKGPMTSSGGSSSSTTMRSANNGNMSASNTTTTNNPSQSSAASSREGYARHNPVDEMYVFICFVFT